MRIVISILWLMVACGPLSSLAGRLEIALAASQEKEGAAPDKVYHLQVQLEGVKDGKAVVMTFKGMSPIRDTFTFRESRIDLSLPGNDTVSVSLRIVNEAIGSPTKNLGVYYPNISLLKVPGETAVLKIKLERGKEPVVEWKNGGGVSHDFIRLNQQQPEPAERAYRQLMIDNIIRGGDIREYDREFDAFMQANKRTIMDFIWKNPTSYVTVMNLIDHYIWFDENEIETIYNQFPTALKGSAYGRLLGRKLEAGRPYRTGTLAADFIKKDMQGREISLKDYRGKYVLLDFWGSWCGPCRESHPHLKELYRQYGDRMVFVNVANENVKDLAQARKLWQQAVEEDGLTWTQILNNEGVKEYNLLNLYHINSFPTKILIDPEGRIVARLVGATGDPAEILEKIFGR